MTINIGMIGAGWRAEFFLRIAKALPEQFNLRRVLVRNPEIEQREGEARGISVVVEFDDIATARAFYESPDYTAARELRESCSETDLLIAEGV
ncbi:MAG: DUF1330 domain-containing protein [Caldilineaceae bacterium]|nr:DUF1330 domain-containing protein [Caldilineaceae bacterium]